MSFMCVMFHPKLGLDLINSCLDNYAPLVPRIVMRSHFSDADVVFLYRKLPDTTLTFLRDTRTGWAISS